MTVEPPHAAVAAAVAIAIAEDLGSDGDLTGAILDEAATATAAIVTRDDGVLAGSACAIEAFRAIDPTLSVRFIAHDGDTIARGDVVATVSGSLRSIVAAERTAINFLGHLSGVATATRAVVDAVRTVSASVLVLDTRKTTPGLRALEKAAVRAGGGTNHRSSLSESVLIKDNHLGAMALSDAVGRATRMWPGRRVEVECDTMAQVHEAIAAGATAILLDNMSPDETARCVTAVRTAPRGVFVEVSGGITAASAPAYAATGVDAMSVGSLTHSVTSLDLGLDLVIDGDAKMG